MHASLRNVAIAGAFVSLFFHACSNHSTGFATDSAGGRDAAGSATDVAPPTDDIAVMSFLDGATGPIPGCPQGNEAIQRDILVPSCGSSGCHAAASPASGLDLVSPAVETRLANVASGCGPILVVPGDAANSYLFQKVSQTSPRCGARMPSAPLPPLDASRIACLEAWIRDGLQPTPDDAGTTSLPDASTTLANYMTGVGTTPSCVSFDTFWNRPAMCAGRDCLSCHRPGGGGPTFATAGTVFPSWQSDITAGVSGAVVRFLNPSTGALMASATTNVAGNFNIVSGVTFPATVEVAYMGRTIRMPSPATSGGCGSCHTLPVTSTAGPGRIFVP